MMNPAPPPFQPQPALDAMVLQPKGNLTGSNPEFAQMLEQAIEQVNRSVIVDFLWVDTIDAAGICLLLQEVERAGQQGKSLTFHSMNYSIWQAMEKTKQAAAAATERQDHFRQDFADFLSRRPQPQAKPTRPTLRPSISYPNPAVVLVRNQLRAA